MTKPSAADLEIRSARPEDESAVIDLLRASLGWRPEDPNEEFFRWKHHDNAFGPSPAWVALHDGRVVGYRTFLRWRFLDDAGRVVTAVRAVDTATDPSYRGMGIFRMLTLRAVADLTLAGDGIVFNTPNDQSRPGYLKMGWSVARRLPVGVLPTGPRAMAAMITSRVPAALWSQETGAGLDAGEVGGQPVRLAGAPGGAGALAPDLDAAAGGGGAAEVDGEHVAAAHAFALFLQPQAEPCVRDRLTQLRQPDFNGHRRSSSRGA